VLVVGAEKMHTTVQSDAWNIDHSEGLMTLMEGGVNQLLRAELLEANKNPFNSVFMGLNAGWARHQIDERGTTLEEAVEVAVKNRANGAINPKARFNGRPVTREEVMESPIVAEPLRMAMCSAFSDGVGALVLTDEVVADRPRIVSTQLLSGDGTMENHDRMTQLSGEVWEEAGIGPVDVDVIEVHDACAFEELWALEACGFYDTGEAGKATLAGRTARSGEQPVNPGGGLIGRGHPVSATGVLQIVELYEQLMGRCGGHQIPGEPKIAFAENQGGLSGYADVAALGMTVLKKD
jgi:acetyl-CoA acetyltransferase